ncbi:hypothetical protein SA87_12030 [Hydrogenibacillus schlegelii]|uniref:ABC transporter domain-containing protein n=1 Tax=Hydrogenibacillus schlegelii TaxID=1484 RepID=A0A179IUK5_HYDSH|nr:hypothetical protein SA87_12030 [Hydrogenibacillus schlegelii]
MHAAEDETAEIFRPENRSDVRRDLLQAAVPEEKRPKTVPLRRMTVLENVMVGAFLHTRRREVAERRALEVLALTGLYERRHEEARTLPIAGRKRLEVARALATEPKLLLLDEVAAGLNPKEVEAVMALIRTLKESGVTILMVEHIMKVVLGVATRALALNFGRTIAAGTPEEVTRHPDVVRAYLGERRHA